MSPKLPVISGEELIRVLRKFGYEVVRQKGSHVRLRNELEPRRFLLLFRFTKKLLQAL